MDPVKGKPVLHLYEYEHPTAGTLESTDFGDFTTPVGWNSNQYNVASNGANRYEQVFFQNAAWNPALYATSPHQTLELGDRKIDKLDLKEDKTSVDLPITTRSCSSWKRKAFAILGGGAVVACAMIPLILKATSTAQTAPSGQDCAGEELSHAYANLTAVASELAGQALPFTALNGTLCNMTAVLQNVAQGLTPYLAASCADAVHSIIASWTHEKLTAQNLQAVSNGFIQLEGGSMCNVTALKASSLVATVLPTPSASLQSSFSLKPSSIASFSSTPIPSPVVSSSLALSSLPTPSSVVSSSAWGSNSISSSMQVPLISSTSAIAPTATPAPLVSPVINIANFTWRQTSLENGLWYGIASSSSGQYLAAGQYNNNIYVSSNYGGTWRSTSAPSGSWNDIVSSSSGQYLAATQNSGRIYVSSNYGANWSKTSGLGQYIASSSSGEYLAAAQNGGNLYFSSNYGSTWSLASGPYGVWIDIASSSSGEYLAAAQYGGNIYVSSNYGGTWNQTSLASGPWGSIASSSSGEYLAAVQYPGYIYVSSNYGTNWSQTSAPSRDWHSIASSSSGQYLVVAQYSGYIYVSSNYGANWSQTSAPFSSYWDRIVLSSNATQIIATQNGGGIWIAS